jgi:hypothetical protein
LRLRRRTVGDVFGKEVYKAGQRKFNFNEFRGQVEGYGKVFL